MKILICSSGSISAYKAASLASLLVKSGDEVQCAVTDSALKFIGPAALEGITRRRVKKDMFEDSASIDHIELARWADVILYYPASAATLARLRMGLAEDLISAVFLANNFEKPCLIAPAMNSTMLAHPATAGNIKKLKEWGAGIIEADDGMLACGELGKGRLAEPERIAAEIDSLRSST